MSLRVSMSIPIGSACSGDMYAGVPMNCPISVNMVCSVSRDCVALAMPKSITLGVGLSSTCVTRMLLGLMSR